MANDINDKSLRDNPSPNPIKQAPAPWTVKCEMYWMFYHGNTTLPEDAYAPLEAQTASFSDPAKAGRFRGGLGMIQIVRYSDTPVGSYDELVLMPGVFDVSSAGSSTTKQHGRITRIYVDQRDTCYNGRKNWGIPKHLARFSFSQPPGESSSSLKVEVFPPHPTSASTPFLTVRLQRMRWVPSFPFSTKLSPYLGLEPALVQPRLEASRKPGQEELTASEGWSRFAPWMYSPKVSLAWADVKRDVGSGQGWWPDVRPWSVCLWVEDATMEIPRAETWGGP
ncbi:MAG: hypothetical protein M1816_003756 [Peltula sp. TS41687]|nr:MAG: hypothetical protein M1816_003756 [Peltula sp. TS41687]